MFHSITCKCLGCSVNFKPLDVRTSFYDYKMSIFMSNFQNGTTFAVLVIQSNINNMLLIMCY